MHRQNWQDIQTFLAVSAQGSVAAAARALDVNASTVFRRLRNLEGRHGAQLFRRLKSGYRPTPLGSALLEAARHMEADALRIERLLAGSDHVLAGEIRIATTAGLATDLLMPHLQRFRMLYPGIRLALRLTNVFSDIARRDADVALRVTREPPETLIGRRIGVLRFAAYAGAGMREDPPWLLPEGELADSDWGRWCRIHLPEAAIVGGANDARALLAAAEQGLGAAVLPCFLGDRAAALARHGEPIAALDTDLWLLTHRELRENARIAAFMEYIGGALKGEATRLAGTLEA
jgi:DNA-binding transcriptional LysR family regulator